MMKSGAVARPRPERWAQMGDMGGAGRGSGAPTSRPRLPEPSVASDVPMGPTGSASGGAMGGAAPGMGATPGMGAGWSGPGAAPGGLVAPAAAWVPLGELADVVVTEGPPMVRNEDGRLAGYVYIDIDDGARDLGGWIDEAHARVDAARADHSLHVPEGFELRWSGQYEQLAQMRERMKLAIPAALAVIVLLLWMQFKNPVEVAIVLLSIPFALVGSVWLVWLLDYRLSTAVWVGVIALIGLAAQTGVVMIVYIDNAFHRRKAAGRIRNLDDIVWAHLEGTVMRVRPKLMTVTTMLVGLVPLLWADGSGADVMKRIAAPMVGGLVTSAMLTLEILPVIYTYWRLDQLILERLVDLDPARRARMLRTAHAAAALAIVAAAFVVLPVYVEVPRAVWGGGAVTAAALAAAAFVVYLAQRPAAKRLVWPPGKRG
jgi:hypothetical protein